MVMAGAHRAVSAGGSAPLSQGFATGRDPHVPAPRAAEEGAVSRRQWVLVAMALAFTMTMIDATIVSVALPTIQREVNLTNSGRVWIVNAYLLVYTVSIAAAGRFADRLGQRRVFMVGLLVFVAGSLAAGLAQTSTLLIAARGVAGLGGALMTPTSQAIVTNAFPIRERGRALGVYAGVSALGVAAGPLLGGVLTTFVGWRWIFYVNLPIGVAAYLITRYANPAQSRDPHAARIDWPGLGLLVLGLAALVVAIMQSGTWGFVSPAFLGTLAVAVLLLVGFVALQLRGRQPLLDLRIFANRDFLADNLCTFMVRFGLFSMSVYAPIFVQDVLGFSAFAAGAATLPATVMLVLVSPRSGRAYDRVGARPLLVTGSLVTAVGFGWLAFAVPHQSYLWLVPAYVVCGVGIALITTPSLTDAMNVAPARQRGEAAGLLGTVQQLGGTIGTAVTTAVLGPLFVHRLAAAVGQPTEGVQTVLAHTRGGTVFTEIPAWVVAAAKAAFASSLAVAFIVVAALMVVSFLVGLLVHTRRRPSGPSSPAVPG
jgi:EmrB/QacA subfamily drug resistance transporter